MISLSAAWGMLGKWVIATSREFCGRGLIMQRPKTGGETTGCLNHSASAGGMCFCVLSGWLYHLLGRCLNLALIQWHLACLKGQPTQLSNWTSISVTSNIKSSSNLCFLHFLRVINCVVSALTGCSCSCVTAYNRINDPSYKIRNMLIQIKKIIASWCTSICYSLWFIVIIV